MEQMNIDYQKTVWYTVGVNDKHTLVILKEEGNL